MTFKCWSDMLSPNVGTGVAYVQITTPSFCGQGVLGQVSPSDHSHWTYCPSPHSPAIRLALRMALEWALRWASLFPTLPCCPRTVWRTDQGLAVCGLTKESLCGGLTKDSLCGGLTKDSLCGGLTKDSLCGGLIKDSLGED